eukprot:CAMPEP_0183379478 /NCGR_PEP_ID=MMETSP0164_2-20130417/125445_1 /TAXON_ID=221442 /ORGANISM="Coccolithus pelagicus ssp braarudi, Strain PLY182g" /LENGTH=315 /DNA_ID=CAMNT_0025557061 /DNA_START=261 /DNA_END=1208 /DNA_ORIENTATION=-
MSSNSPAGGTRQRRHNIGKKTPTPMPSKCPVTHFRARLEHPKYPPRWPVKDEEVSWEVGCAGYQPVEFVSSVVIANDRSVNPQGWADSAEPDCAVIEARTSYEYIKQGRGYQFTEAGRPRNPVGRTGIQNRGALGKWGANHAADPIVTRRNPHKPGKPLEVVVIRRRDTGEWAIPGGMVDPGELVSETLRREFTEEAGNVSEAERPRFERLAAELFRADNGREVYRGYVDDPRNTDNAWMETVAMHFHCDAELASLLELHAGDDAADVQWLEVGEHVAQYRNLYANHKEFVDKVVLTHGTARPSAATSNTSSDPA